MMIRIDGTSKERLHIGIATKQSATRSTKTQLLGRDSVDIGVGHDFRADRGGAGRDDKQGGDLVEFRCVLRNVLPHDDMDFNGISPRPALHQCLGGSGQLRQCHIPYDSSHATAMEYVKLLLFKTERGAKDFWYESRKTIATKEEWEKQRPQLRTEFESYTKAHNYITCRGCHSLEAFGGPRSRMKTLIHKDLIKANTFDCFQCHQDVGHVYEEPVAKVGGWYTAEQAASGANLYQAQCANCHGAKLEGGAGPSLKGTTWHQMYGGAKLLTVWGEITGPMAQYAGTTYTTQQSLDIVSFLLQQNGLPSGNQPLADRRELSDVLPAK